MSDERPIEEVVEALVDAIPDDFMNIVNMMEIAVEGHMEAEVVYAFYNIVASNPLIELGDAISGALEYCDL